MMMLSNYSNSDHEREEEEIVTIYSSRSQVHFHTKHKTNNIFNTIQVTWMKLYNIFGLSKQR